MNHAVVKGVVESAVLGKNKATAVEDTLGRRGAMTFLERSAAAISGQAAAKAFKALSDHVKGEISAAVAEIAAFNVGKTFNMKNPTVAALAQAGAAIMSGNVSPLRAGAEIIKGAANGIFNLFEGGYNDNWCYIEVGDLRREFSKTICAGAYKGNDRWYFKTYQNKYYSSDKKDFFSAGNKQMHIFKLHSGMSGEIALKPTKKFGIAILFM